MKKAAWGIIDGKKRSYDTAPSYTYDSGWVEVVFREYAIDFISESTRQNEECNARARTEWNAIHRRILPPLVLLTWGTASGYAYAPSLTLDVAQGFRTMRQERIHKTRP
jgi:hypothetical protein